MRRTVVGVAALAVATGLTPSPASTTTVAEPVVMVDPGRDVKVKKKAIRTQVPAASRAEVRRAARRTDVKKVTYRPGAEQVTVRYRMREVFTDDRLAGAVRVRQKLVTRLSAVKVIVAQGKLKTPGCAGSTVEFATQVIRVTVPRSCFKFDAVSASTKALLRVRGTQGWARASIDRVNPTPVHFTASAR